MTYNAISYYERKNKIKLPYKLISTNKTLDHDFFKKWNSNMAYCVGFLLADGCLMCKDKTYHIKIALSPKDGLYLRKLANLMGCSHAIHTSGKKKLTTIMISNKTMFNDLVEIGITPRKTLTVKWIDQCPVEYQRDLVRGILDGDGCVCTRDNKTIQVTFVGTESVLDGIKNSFKNFSGKSISTIYKIKKAKAFRYVISGNRNCSQFLDWIYSGSTDENRMTRKYIIYEKFIKEYAKIPRTLAFINDNIDSFSHYIKNYSSSHSHQSSDSPQLSQISSSSEHSPQQSDSPHSEQQSRSSFSSSRSLS